MEIKLAKTAGFCVGLHRAVDEWRSFDKVCVVAQTTPDSENYSKIVEKIKNIYPHAIVFYAICSSAEQRQVEVIKLSGQFSEQNIFNSN